MHYADLLHPNKLIKINFLTMLLCFKNQIENQPFEDGLLSYTEQRTK